MKNDQICHELVVAHDLALLVLDVFGDDPFPAEEGPFDEAVEFLALVGRRVDSLAHFDIVDVVQQEQRAHYLAEFTE